MRRASTARGRGAARRRRSPAAPTTPRLPTTPTFSAARYVPAVPAGGPAGAGAGARAPPGDGRAGSPASRRSAAANRESTVEPDDASMRGATWYIEDVRPVLIYRVCTQPAARHDHPAAAGRALQRRGRRQRRRVPDQRRLRRPAAGGLDPAADGGRRRQPPARHHRRLLHVLAVERARGAQPRRTCRAGTTPAGRAPRRCRSPRATSRGSPLVREDGPLPAWAPAEAWADSAQDGGALQRPAAGAADAPRRPEGRAGGQLPQRSAAGRRSTW